ncbi:hypothetical protein DCC62_20845 [candidate division KSB1 bacterium]|nr:MAG: hypothetical protein DCC62_20845 [candidate division KSB1 bacterium]
MKLSHTSWIVLSAAVMLPIALVAQPMKSYGVKAGLNFSNLIIEDERSSSRFTDTERRTGLNAALFGELGVSSVMSVVAQVEYAQYGYIEEATRTLGTNPGATQTARGTTRLDYVSVPVMVKLQSSPGPYLAFGPRIDWLVNRSPGVIEFKHDGITDTGVSGWPELLKETTYGGVVGLGVAANKIWKIPVIVEARYNFDFTDNIDDDMIPLRAKKNVFDVWVGIEF